MRKKLAVMMAAMAATAMVGGCGAKDAAPTGAETKPAETSVAQETEAAQEETKEADAHLTIKILTTSRSWFLR